MEQITVSDIPLPGETYDFKRQPESEIKANIDTDTIPVPEPPQSIVVTDNEAQKIAAEFLEDVTDADDCVTSEIITESVAELQMEVEQSVHNSNMETNNVDAELIISTDTVVDEIKQTENNIVEMATIVEEQQTNETIVEAVETETETTQLETIVEEPTIDETTNKDTETPDGVAKGDEHQIIIDIFPEQEPEESQPEPEPEPAKINKRSNSTIEAIKNDWITIEEINEEISEPSSPTPEPIVVEPAEKTNNTTEKPEAIVIDEEIPAIVVIESLQDMDNNIAIEIIEPEPVIIQEAPVDDSQSSAKLDITEVGEKEDTTLTIHRHDGLVFVEQETNEKQPEPQSQPQKEVQEPQPQPQEKVSEPEIKPKPKYEVVVVANNNDPPRKRGRPSKGVQRSGDKLPIPCHVMGRNVDNPQEDLISNGRTPPKPRLGVKVPYRFLTSQIVSKEEIADELIEITNKRNPAPDPPAGGDIFFASKLTQRLATKIANANKKKTTSESVVESTSGIPIDALNNTTTTITTDDKQKTIRDNSDLLAILEGDGDVDWTNEVHNNKTNTTTEETKVIVANQSKQVAADVSIVTSKKNLDPEMEREIALKQLAQLPRKGNRGRPRKYPLPEPTRTSTRTTEQPQTPPKQQSPVGVKKEIVVVSPKPIKENESSKPTLDLKQAVSKISQKIQENIKQESNNMDLESDLNVNPKRVTKTYSRKETVVDIPIPTDLELNVDDEQQCSALVDKEEQPKSSEQPQKTNKSADNTPEIRRSKRGAAPEVVTLVSKRARVIKKKVIWDPAEVPKTQVLNAIRRAQALEMKAKKRKQREEVEESSSDTEDEKPIKHKDKDSSKTAEKKDEKPVKRKQREEVEEVEESSPDTEDEKPNRHKATEKKHVVKKTNVRELRKTRLLTKVQKKILMKRQLRSLKSRFRSTNGELKSSIALSKKKKQVMAEIAKQVNKNRKTEIDKLLGDEGAVNMLYSVKTKSRGRGRPNIMIPQKDLLNRARAVKETLTSQSEEGKALRNSTPIRKKSRDSVRSSLQSPPPSPTVSYRGTGAEASRIIRRHSSSFSSDSSTPRRLSVDQSEETNPRNLRRKPNTPEKKTDKLTAIEKKKLNIEMSKNFDKKRKVKKENEEDNEYKEIIVKSCNGFYQICLNYPTNAKLKDSISLQMFNELNAVLNKLSVDNNCKIVALTSKGKSFCNGLDFSYLIQTTAEKRSQAATEMSKTLKEFICTISKFPKVLIAVLHSSASYLGCTMLPYFDFILCSEDVALSADYPRLGQSPEGAPLVSLSPKIGQTLTSQLLLMGKKFTAKEALDTGLINQIEKADKLDEALVEIGEDIGSKSQQSLTATKSLLRQPMLTKLGEALELEQKLLIEHWTSAECQQTFKKLLQEQEVW